MKQTTKRTVQREVEVTEEFCEVTGEKLLVSEDGKPMEVTLPHFRLPLELVGPRDDGAPFTWRLAKGDAPRVTVGQLLKILTPGQLGELFPSFVFEATGHGGIRRRTTSHGKPKGPEVGG
jgi:hypothetical protein